MTQTLNPTSSTERKKSDAQRLVEHLVIHKSLPKQFELSLLVKLKYSQLREDALLATLAEEYGVPDGVLYSALSEITEMPLARFDLEKPSERVAKKLEAFGLYGTDEAIAFGDDGQTTLVAVSNPLHLGTLMRVNQACFEGGVRFYLASGRMIREHYREVRPAEAQVLHQALDLGSERNAEMYRRVQELKLIDERVLEKTVRESRAELDDTPVENLILERGLIGEAALLGALAAQVPGVVYRAYDLNLNVYPALLRPPQEGSTPSPLRAEVSAVKPLSVVGSDLLGLLALRERLGERVHFELVGERTLESARKRTVRTLSPLELGISLLGSALLLGLITPARAAELSSSSSSEDAILTALKLDEVQRATLLAFQTGKVFDLPDPLEVQREAREGVSWIRSGLEQAGFAPFAMTPSGIVLYVDDPRRRDLINRLEASGGKVAEVRVTTKSHITRLLDATFSLSSAGIAASVNPREERQSAHDVLADSEETSVYIREMLHKALSMNASDIHIEMHGGEYRLRYRVNGNLVDMERAATQGRGVHSKLINKFKLMGRIDVAEKNLEGSGRYTLITAAGNVELRIATMPIHGGEQATLRLLRNDRSIPGLAQLGLEGRALSAVSRLVNHSEGILVMCGPTGSGKTTTAYSFLQQLNTPNRKIITIEDPIEYTLPGVNHSAVNRKVNYGFAEALTAMLRCDPDIIMVGELRESEATRIAYDAANTGHLVITTTHANDSLQAPGRLIKLGVERYMVAAQTRGIIAQRLVGQLCSRCKAVATLEKAHLERLLSYLGGDKTQLAQAIAEVKAEGTSPMWASPVGCPQCFNSGYTSRIAVYEVFEPDDELSEMIGSANTSSRELRDRAQAKGMTTMAYQGVLHILRGYTSWSEVYTRVPPPRSQGREG